MESFGGRAGTGDGRALVFGTVRTFDEHRGLGVVVEGGSEWPFHCTAIADGSRTIEVGTNVVFRPVPGHLGWMEASDIQDLDAAGGP